METKEIFYLKIVNGYKRHLIDQRFTTKDIQVLIGQKRNLISHYLNRLVEDEKLKKTETRPVYYSIANVIAEDKDFHQKTIPEQINLFSELIGSSGSLRKQVESCKAAVTYPPNGLPILLSGSSGSGKSYLATLIYKFACTKKVIELNAPLITLNCADFANNPELMSDTLFGHKKGAYTGADTDKSGLLDHANGGFLFLDEVHRLSPENQEKLFLFLDQGRYRRLGENELIHSSNVRFIFATTEDIENTLLETFRRRIPLRVTLPDYLSRPMQERTDLINQFFQHEASNLHHDLLITSDLYKSLVFFNGKGNIGSIKNEIKVMCAEAYTDQSNNSVLELMTESERIAQTRASDPEKFYKINKDQDHYINFLNPYLPSKDVYRVLLSFNRDSNVNLLTKSLFEFFERQNGSQFQNQFFFKFLLLRIKDNLQKISRFIGIPFDEKIVHAAFLIFAYFMAINRVPENRQYDQSDFTRFHRKYSKSDLIAQRFTRILEQEFNGDRGQRFNETFLQSFDTLFRQAIPLVENSIQGVIVAHGETIASNIASVANRLCNGYQFDSFDMPLDTNTTTIINQISDYLEHVETKSGVILLIDMGSLTDLYEPIKSHLRGGLLMINNITTSMAIDIGMKIKNQIPLDIIINDAKTAYKTEIRYYEGIAMNDNIVISCISGVGIAKKIMNIVTSFLQDDQTEVITLEYSKLKRSFTEGRSSMFRKTKLIISTTPLETGSVPFISIHEMIGKGFQEMMKSFFSGLMDEDHFNGMIDEIVKLFTIQGAASRLKFLNPSLVVDEIADIISQFEEYYSVHFQSYVRMNLFLHISAMIERLMIGEGIADQTKHLLSSKQKDFCELTDEVFKKVSHKYRVHVPVSEKLMILEIIKMNFDQRNIKS
ncbi:MAG: sigma 54-interacting transcriptional regulator [Sporolactobacillus sp.]